MELYEPHYHWQTLIQENIAQISHVTFELLTKELHQFVRVGTIRNYPPYRLTITKLKIQNSAINHGFSQRTANAYLRPHGLQRCKAVKRLQMPLTA